MTTPYDATFYYRKTDLENFKGSDYDTEIPNSLAYNKIQTTLLFTDSSCATVGGNGFFNIAVLNTPNPAESTTYLSFDTELGYYFINSGTVNGCIYFNVSIIGSTTPGFVPAGSTNVRQITGGSGGFFGVTGKITLTVDSSSGLRTVAIAATIPA